MRIALTLAALLASSATALADDILIRADIAQATVFLSGAEVTRRAEVTIPAGEHRLLIAMPDAGLAHLVGVEGPEGVILGQPSLMTAQPLTIGALDDPQQAAARNLVLAAEDALAAAVDTLALSDGAIRAIEMQLAYLDGLSGDGMTGTDPALLSQLLSTLGAETARLEGALHAARIARRDPAQAVEDRQEELARALDALARLSPFDNRVDMVALSVTAAQATMGAITLDYFTHAAHWTPSHELRLETGRDALSLARFVTVAVEGPARWHNVAMRFSTAEPFRQRDPSPLWPDPARIMEPRTADTLTMSEGMSDRLMQPVSADARAVLAVEGLAISFDYTTPVSIDATGKAVLPLDPLSLPTVTEARAVPRRDQTAFLVATVQNDSGAPILPGQARFFRDGALIGEDWLPLIAAGAEAELGFGPLDHLPLIWIDRSLAEGDRGIFTTARTQSSQIAFGVRNLSDRPETVRLLYATPFAEQEALTLRLSLTPEPDARDQDDQRGVHAWALDLPPGAQRLIEMTAAFDWPAGQVLLWQP
jgi:uncharacterized protein (TIGR02231 family)